MRDGELIDPRKDDAYVAALKAAGGFGPRGAPAALGDNRAVASPRLASPELGQAEPVSVKAPIPAASLRPIGPIPLACITVAKLGQWKPAFEWVEPDRLLVDEAYQRALSDRSMRLIRKIIAGWDWARFKPPIVARTLHGLEVIDGQHTAIAAVSHPGIDKIPIMLVSAEARAERANAFVGHNRDRLAITPMQLHAAAAAAGDPEACTVERLCAEERIRILRVPPTNGGYRPGDLVAVQAVTKLLRRQGEGGVRQVLRVCAQAGLAPVSRDMLLAIEGVLFSAEFAGDVAPAAIVDVFADKRDRLEREAQLFAHSHKVTVGNALAATLYRLARKKRGA
jgi:hypothetical protein